jgi:hypothetical protein
VRKCIAHRNMTTALHRENGCEPIRKITREEVERGGLLESFRKGAVAAVLREDARTVELFRSVLDWLGFEASSNRENFGASLVDLARNHLEANADAGDMLRFQPGVFGHLARKFLVFRMGIDQPLMAFPNAFHLGNKRIPIPHNILEAAWNLMAGVLMSAMSGEVNPSAYAAEVDILLYPISNLDLDNLATLLADSSGAWSRLGHLIDANKGKATGIFDRKVVRDLFGIAALIPGLRELLMMLNRRLSTDGEGFSPGDYQIVGCPHVDWGKYITGLIGSRHNLRTQIFWANRWVQLPVTPNMMTIFPGAKIGSINNIPPTRHRIILDRPRDGESTAARNVTLSLSIVSRPASSSEATL